MTDQGAPAVGVIGSPPADLLGSLDSAGIAWSWLDRADLEAGSTTPAAGAYLVFEETNAALEISQLINRAHPGTPVLLFSDHPSELKHQLQSTPILGPSAVPIGTDDLPRIREVIDDALHTAGERRTDSQTLGRLLDFAPIGVVLCESDGRVLASNPRAQQITPGLTNDPASDLSQIFPASSSSIQQLLTSQGRIGPVLLERATDAGTQYLEATAAPFLDERNRNLALVLLDDVTARVDAERSMREAQESLLFEKMLLESQSQALADGVLVVGTDGRMISFNRAFIEMWSIPQQVVDSRLDEEAVRSVASQVVDPQAFTQRVQYLYDHPDEESTDEIALLDGRIFERYSAPVVGEEGRLFGRMWYFRDITQIRQREQTLALLAAATEAASSTTDMTQNLRRIGRLAVEKIADVCLIYLVGDEGVIDRVELSARDPEMGAYLQSAVQPFVIDPDSNSGVAQVLRDGEPLLATHADARMMATDVTDPEGLLAIIGPIGIESWICVPIQAHRRSIGAISLVSLDPSRRFGQEDLDLAMGLGRRVSLGIQTVRMGERERNIAETLQRSLLPQELPEVPGLEIASRYVAGSEGMEIGGDWFEVGRLRGGKVLAVIGDVAGKGLRAAAVMGETRAALRAYSAETDSPAEMVARLNRLLMESDEMHMATLLCAVIDTRENNMRFVSAGHPPPIVLNASGQARYITGGLHPPLGVAVRLDAEKVEEFPPGSTLVLYTDGAFERRDRPIDEGLEELRRVVEATGSNPERICEEIVRFGADGTAATDDVAILAMTSLPFDNEELTLAVTANAKSLVDIRSSLQRWLGSHKVPIEVADEIVLAANEACANAIEHAYPPQGGSFDLWGRIEDRSVVITVKDYGRWRDPVPSEEGRGLSVMGALMDEVDVATTSEGTTVTLRHSMTSSLDKPPAPAVAAPEFAGQRTAGVVSLSGDLDLARTRSLTQHLLAQQSSDSPGMILDLSDVGYIDSSGIRMLFVLDEKLRERRQQLTVVVPEGSPLRRMLELSAVETAVQIVTERPRPA